MSEEECKDKCSIKEKVLDLVTVNFNIKSCPEKIHQEFSEFCKVEANDNYPMGLKLLLDAKNSNIKEALLFEQYMELKVRVEELEKQLQQQPDEPKKAKPKTFGNK